MDSDNSKKLKIVFFGTPEFAVESLDRLRRDGHEIAAVVTAPDKIAGRGHKLLQSDVKKYALANDITVLQPEKLRDPVFLDQLKNLEADLFVVIAFRMLPEVVWGMPPLGTFNLHGSLLPKYRGAAPINRAIMNGEKETGITTFFLTHEIDTGDIIDRRSITIGENENAGSVHDRLMHLGAEMVSDTVKAIVEGRVHTEPQPEGEFTPAPKIFKEDCRIDWNRKSVDLHNHIRGLAPYPAAYSTLIEKSGRPLTVKILGARLPQNDEHPPMEDAAPGTALALNRRLFVKTADGALEILSIQPAGKRGMDTRDFLLGYHPDHFTDSL